jgi:tRNA A-37 threonylcarbamoyl transferase component Bud32/TolB-like protein/Tfp pilus assembly protein PilF
MLAPVTHDRTWTDEVTESPAGPRVGGRYELLALVGQGAMGTVYRAQDRELDEVVALKVIRPERAHEPAMLGRLRQEVKLARRITHPNVVRIFDLGEEGDARFVTMEYLEGGTLAEHLADHGWLPAPLVRHVGIQVCLGLQAAHAAGVVHRDLKPDNVLLGAPAADGFPRVAISDFGVAASPGTVTGVAGTPAYMAPEQLEGGALDGRTDLYAVGAILFEVLTGRKVWPDATDLEHARARALRAAPHPRSVRPAACPHLSAIALRCLARDAADRFPTADALRDALEAAPVVAERAPEALARPSIRARTVLLMPLRVEPEGEAWLGRSLAAEVAELLARSAALRVRTAPPGRESAPGAARSLAREVGADVVLEGVLRVAGDELELRIALVGAVDGYVLVEQAWVFPRGGVLDVSADVAAQVASALTVEITARSARAAPEVLEAVLRARYLARRGWTVRDLGEARALLEGALARAPGDPLVSSSLALVLAREAFREGDAARREQWMTSACALAEHAAAQAPDASEPHLALGLVCLYGGEPVEAATALRLAAERSPGNPQIQHLLGMMLLEVGALDLAERHLDAALAIDPRFTEALVDRARLHAYRADWAAAAEDLRPRSRDWGQLLAVVHASWRLRMWSPEIPVPDEVAPELWEQARTEAPWYVEFVVLTRAAAEGRGDVPGLRDAQAPQDGAGPRLLSVRCQLGAEVAVHLGRRDAAEGFVACAVDAGLIDVQWMDRCPVLAPVREAAWFPPLRARVAERAAAVRAALQVRPAEDASGLS